MENPSLIQTKKRTKERLWYSKIEISIQFNWIEIEVVSLKNETGPIRKGSHNKESFLNFLMLL